MFRKHRLLHDLMRLGRICDHVMNSIVEATVRPTAVDIASTLATLSLWVSPVAPEAKGSWS